MTSLSADKMASLREQIAKPPRAHSPSQALVRSADMVNVAPRIEDAEAGLREATARGDIVVETDAGRSDGTRSARLDQLERSVRTSIGCAR